MKVLKTRRKNVFTLEIGTFIAREFLNSCKECNYTTGSEELRSIVPERCNFGYNVIVYVGKAFFLYCQDAKKIVSELRQKNITISRREVYYLAMKFIIYLAFSHKMIQKKIRKYLNMQGSYILHLDGTCEGESPHLISVLDGISTIVLDNIKIKTENAEDLIVFLKRIKKAYGNPAAVVVDMAKGIDLAIREVFPGIPIYICHYHFLKALGGNLFGKENDTIRKRLKNYGIGGVLRRRARSLKKIIESQSSLADEFTTGIKNENIMNCSLEYVPVITVYTLLMWTLDGKNDGDGFGFPFDQVYLSFYQRLKIFYTILHKLYEIKLRDDWKDNRIYDRLRRAIVKVINDSVLEKAADKMEEKVAIFNDLRKAMRITIPESKRGLNDNGELLSNKTIEEGVRKFRNRIIKNKKYMNDKDYEKMIQQIDENWDKLFSDPIIVQTEGGKKVIYPQRTNNIMEQFFRDLARIHRKRTGFNSMEKTLKTIQPDTPLVKNLEKKEYMDILLAGYNTLEERFAQIETKMIREEIERLKKESDILLPKIKKIIQTSDLPETLVKIFKQKAA